VHHTKDKGDLGVVTLRIVPSKNDQHEGVWFAADFRDVPEYTPMGYGSTVVPHGTEQP
jgi:hypothetical protein